MHDKPYQIAPANSEVQGLTVAWLWLGIYSLLAAGLLSLLLALSRTPVIQDLMPSKDFFHIALVVHVDLSVLIWFLAGASIMWTVLGVKRKTIWDSLGFGLLVLGTVMISIAPFVGADKPLMNNYVPVLQHPWFIVSLMIVGAGLVVQVCRYLSSNLPNFRNPDHFDMLRFALFVAALAALIAVLCVAAAYYKMPADVDAKTFYELLFWGGGHVLQFTHAVMMLVAWLVLSAASGCTRWFTPRVGMVLFSLVVIPLLVVPWLYSIPVESKEHVHNFTALMRYGGLTTLPLGALIFLSIFSRDHIDPKTLHLRAALICSMGLFAAGGLIGFMIKGSNTVIPAHYHGSIVGVTLAFMGIVYYLLPKLGREITCPKMAHWQPYVYGTGQLMHITGLAWSGGYGVQRKTAGAAQGLDSIQEIAGMGLMGMGGLVSVIGGLLFLVVAISALRAKRSPVSKA